VTAQAPAVANTGETINLSAQAEAGGVPAVAYHWDLGDGTSAVCFTLKTYLKGAPFYNASASGNRH
jgi:hypothetical protein